MKFILTVVLLVFIFLVNREYKNSSNMDTYEDMLSSINNVREYLKVVASLITLIFFFEIVHIIKEYQDLKNKTLVEKTINVLVCIIYIISTVISWLSLKSTDNMIMYIETVQTFASVIVAYNFIDLGIMLWKIKSVHSHRRKIHQELTDYEKSFGNMPTIDTIRPPSIEDLIYHEDE